MIFESGDIRTTIIMHGVKCQLCELWECVIRDDEQTATMITSICTVQYHYNTCKHSRPLSFPSLNVHLPAVWSKFFERCTGKQNHFAFSSGKDKDFNEGSCNGSFCSDTFLIKMRVPVMTVQPLIR